MFYPGVHTSYLEKYEKHNTNIGAIAQLGEHLICIQEVCGSIPHSSTSLPFAHLVFMSGERQRSQTAYRQQVCEYKWFVARRAL